MDSGLKRSFDHDFLNYIINHPEVKEGCKSDGNIDLSEKVKNKNNIFLANEHGGMLLLWLGDGMYSLHTQFLEAGRGKLAYQFTRDAARYMFIKTPCTKIITFAYPDNKRSVSICRSFMKYEGFNGEYRYYSLSYEDWVKTDVICKNEGDEFHDLVKDTANHDDDDDHDYQVGAAILMVKSGNIEKAEILYNRWAIMSGYEQIETLTMNPLIAQIGDMTLSFDEKLEVI